MSNTRKYYTNLAKTRVRSGDVWGALTASFDAFFKGKPAVKVKKAKPVAIKPVTTSFPVVADDTFIPEVSSVPLNVEVETKKASIYNWGTVPTISAIPFGYLGAQVITIDFTAGDILFKNDIMRKNIDTLLAGLVRTEGNTFIAVNDPLSSFFKWEKHFAFIAKNEQDTSATITALWFMMDNLIEEKEYNNDNIFLFVNNIHTLSGTTAELLKEILVKGKKVGLNVVAIVDDKHYSQVEASYGDNFEYVVSFNFSETVVKSAGFNGELNPYTIPGKEIAVLERTEGNYYRSDFLAVPTFRVYNDIQDLNASGELEISDKVFQFLMTSENPLIEVAGLSYTEAEEFMKIIMNSKYSQLASDYAAVVDNLSELLLVVDTRLAAGNDEKHVIPRVVEKPFALKASTPTPIKAYTRTELDDIVTKTIKAGLLQQLATLTDEEIDTVEDVYKVTSKVPREKAPSASSIISTKPEDDVATDTVSVETNSNDNEVEFDEDTINLTMIGYGFSTREEAIAELSK